MHFPAATGSNLERREFKLPADLEGERNLVILAFWRHHQALVDTWMPFAQRLQQRHADLVAYELPVIESRGRIAQWFIDSGMRAGIPDRSTREHTITLYLDKKAFLDALDIEDDSTIYTMLIDRAGNVLWRTSGPLDQEKEIALEGFLESRPNAAGVRVPGANRNRF
jgi:hypothetical protein